MSKGKIVVIGANQCGLVFAKFASEAGFSVSVYEQKDKSEVAYDWTDDMAEITFEQIGIPKPPKDVYTRKRSWTFVPPDKSKCIYLELPESELDLALYRRPFNNYLEGLALNSGANIFYNKCVKKLIAEGKKATGIMLDNGEKIEADMVVDCGGANSSVRKSVPLCFGIENEISPDDTFFVRRAFYNRPSGTPRPEFTNKAYLKHMNEKGISWCLLSYDEQAADVLIGRAGGLTDENYYKALDDLKKTDCIIGDKKLSGGQLLKIPVRHPIRSMIADGYALVGDSAFMTIPMLGSGMASGMRAAKMLAEVLKKPVGDAFSKGNLYRYQREFMLQIGAKHAAVDLMKIWLLNSKEGETDFLLCKGVICNNVLKQASAGEPVKMTVAETITAGIKGIRKPLLLLKLVGLLIKMNKQIRVAKKMPKVYDENSFIRWQKKYEKAYRRG